MWCHHCDSDVAAEIGPGGQRVHCANCGTEIAARGTPVQATRTREALQLLDRWSRPQLLDPFQTTPGQERETDEPEIAVRPDDAPEEVDVVEADLARSADEHCESDPDEPAEEPVLERREPADGTSTESTSESTVESEWDESDSEIAAEDSDEYADEYESVETLIPHQSRIAVAAIGTKTEHGPTNDAARRFTEIPMSDESPVRSHGTVRDAIAPDESVNWVALAGQLLAYGGVAVLTIGTTVALWAHFTGQPSHVPTGWLVAAAGQMLLFLGVVTLVSTGIEQTAIDLQRRFDRVADRLDRVESRLETSRTGRTWTTRIAESSRDDVDERIAA